MINETLAKRAKENMSFSDYKVGSATAEYNAQVEEAKSKIDNAKERVSDEGKEKLDKLFERYKCKLANWTNKHNENGASHVSVMIAGASNYNMTKHNSYLNRERKLWEEYDEIKDIDLQISRIINGDKIISSDDPNALVKLKSKLEDAENNHQMMIEQNKKARKEGGKIYASCTLSNSRQRINSIKKRINDLESKLNDQTETILVLHDKGIEILDNVEANRVQIFFNGKPDECVRNDLKSSGFRWSGKYMAWQRKRSVRARFVACQLVERIAVK